MRAAHRLYHVPTFFCRNSWGKDKSNGKNGRLILSSYHFFGSIRVPENNGSPIVTADWHKGITQPVEGSSQIQTTTKPAPSQSNTLFSTSLSLSLARNTPSSSPTSTPHCKSRRMIAAIRFVSMVISGSLLVLLQLPLRVSGQESMACPFQGSVIPLTQSLSMRAVRDLTTEMLHVQMTSSLGGWIGFALSPTGQMVGSVAAVGQLVPNLETAWYSLNGKTRAQVVPVPDVTLEDATMVQTESTSVFTFSIPLPDVPSGAAVRFIYGAGGTPALGYHLIRGSREFVFDECPPPP